MEKSIPPCTAWSRVLFVVTVVFILAMMLMGRDLLNDVYRFCALVMSVDPAWVKKHATGISNTGHLVSSFILTCLGFYVFRANYLKVMGFVASLAVLGEFLQEFTKTRQPNLEDVALGFAGIVLASVVFFYKASVVRKNSENCNGVESP